MGRRGLAGVRDVAAADASDPDPVRAESEGKSEEVGARQADNVIGDAGKYSRNVDVLEPQQGRTAGQLHGVEDLVEGG